jgi:hypothetical protein
MTWFAPLFVIAATLTGAIAYKLMHKQDILVPAE